MKLRYVGQEEYIILHEIPNAEGGKGIRVERNSDFEAPPEVAATLLGVNRQHVRPIFIEALVKDDGLDLLDDKPVVARKMSTPQKTV